MAKNNYVKSRKFSETMTDLVPDEPVNNIPEPKPSTIDPEDELVPAPEPAIDATIAEESEEIETRPEEPLSKPVFAAAKPVFGKMESMIEELPQKHEKIAQTISFEADILFYIKDLAKRKNSNVSEIVNKVLRASL